MHVHLSYHVEPNCLDWFCLEMHGHASVSQGDKPQMDTTVLVSGLPSIEDLASLKSLTHVVVPFAGLLPAARENLLSRPELIVYNLHFNAASTAEKAIELLLAVARQTVTNDRSMRQGDWSPRFDHSGAICLDGKTALVIGLGAIGQRVARICTALGMTVIGVNRSGKRTQLDCEVYSWNDLAVLWPRAEVVLVCAPLTDETRGLVHSKALALLPQSAIVVNIGRGPIIDEQAIFNALQSGKLHGAGFDVWWQYPDGQSRCAPSKYPLEKLDNVVMSPHNGGTVVDTEISRLRALSKLIQAIISDSSDLQKVDVQLGY